MRRSQTRYITFYRFWPRIPGITCYLCLALFCTACGNTSATAQPSSTSQPATSATSTPVLHVTPTPTLQPGPPPRTGAEIAYDEKTKTLVLFGGYDYTGLDNSLNKTWTWDGTTWNQQHPAVSPPALTEASMVYDAATGQVVLFGGAPQSGYPVSGATWTWDGQNWTRRHPASSPSARQGASMAYDAATRTVVLFSGGQGINGGPGGGGGPNPTYPAPVNDTWSWNGSTWVHLHPGAAPPARLYGSMAYDAARQQIVLFGGNDGNAADPLLTDTWTWDGTTWTRHHPVASPSLPSPAINMSMAYNAVTRHIALMIHSQELWTWNGSTWSRARLQNPAEDRGLLFYKPDQQALFALTETVVVEDAGRCVDKLWKLTDQGWQQLPAWD